VEINETEDEKAFSKDGLKSGLGTDIDSWDKLVNDNIFDVANGEWYLYYTTRTVYTNETNVSVADGSWSKPEILRYVVKSDSGIEDLIGLNEIEQLNTFNNLTKNGTSQGLFYTQEGYKLTNDGRAQAGKEYFVKKYKYLPYQYQPDIDIEFFVIFVLES
jgi:hypothetical protein